MKNEKEMAGCLHGHCDTHFTLVLKGPSDVSVDFSYSVPTFMRYLNHQSLFLSK